MDALKEDILQEISDEDIPKLRELYKINWPYWIITYNHLEVQFHWKTEHKKNIKFYSPEGKWNDGTFISILQNDNKKVGITLGTLQDSGERLFKALIESKIIKWEDLPFLNIINKNDYKSVLDAITYHGLELNMLATGVYLWLPAEEALKFEVIAPPGTYFKRLDVSHTELVNSIWPHRGNGWSYDYLSNLIKLNMSLGIFIQETDELVSWGMLNDYGMLAIVQTVESHQRKGYATIISKAISRKFAEVGRSTVVTIMVNNIASKTMYKKMGFKNVNYVCWMHLCKQ